MEKLNIEGVEILTPREMKAIEGGSVFAATAGLWSAHQ